MTYDPCTTPNAPKRGMSTGTKIALGCGIPAALLLVFAGGCTLIVGSAVNEVDKQVQKDKNADVRAAKEDVELLSCSIEDSVIGPDVEAKVKITNNGDKRANYFVEGEFLDQDGNKIDELLATVNDLAPGTSSTQDFTGLMSSDQLEGVTKGTCKILNVSRDEWLANN